MTVLPSTVIGSPTTVFVFSMRSISPTALANRLSMSFITPSCEAKMGPGTGGGKWQAPRGAAPPSGAYRTSARGTVAAPASSSRQLDQHDIGLPLHLLQHDLTPVGRDVEVAHVEVWREVGDPALRAGLQIDQPEILVPDLSP